MSEVVLKESLSNVATATLEVVLDALHKYRTTTPFSRASLAALGVKSQSDALLKMFEGHSRSACIALLETSLAERRKHVRPAPELVWTGPDDPNPTARDATTVMRELLDGARQRVVIAGYTFDKADAVLQVLHAAMRDHGVVTHVFVDVRQPEAKVANEDAYAQSQLDAFAKSTWPFGDPTPAFHCDRRALRPSKGGESSSLLARCITVDGTRTLISSANFASHSRERNIEVGVVIEDPTFANQLERQFLDLVQANLAYTRR